MEFNNYFKSPTYKALWQIISRNSKYYGYTCTYMPQTITHTFHQYIRADIEMYAADMLKWKEEIVKYESKHGSIKIDN